MTADRPLRLVVLISGRGSNLQALLEGTHNGSLPAQICGVISNRPEAAGLERARQAKVKALSVDHRAFGERTAFEAALTETIDHFEPQLVLLAGFMRILNPTFVEHYRGRMLNIHPSLLPKFRGLHTHQRALAEGETEHGASVHFVTPQLDGGPVALQARVPILPGDDPDSLAARVLAREQRIYPLAVRWFAQGRLALNGERVTFDGRPLTTPLDLDNMTEEES